MARPQSLTTKIFLDSGDPKETRRIKNMLGFLDGQTTNPTLISRNPEVRERLERGEKFTNDEILSFYKDVVKEIREEIPDGSVSVEVYADKNTSAEEMIRQARQMNEWIPNAHIKLPISVEGLTAAEQAVRENMRVNMTLCFTEEQAAAVYSATKGAERGDVFVSPFVGRLDDHGENGMDLITNILRMYEKGDGHVEVLTASVRSLEHVLAALAAGTDIITVSPDNVEAWNEKGMPIPDNSFSYTPKELASIPYIELSLEKPWREYDIKHKLTNRGMEKFSADWNSLLT